MRLGPAVRERPGLQGQEHAHVQVPARQPSGGFPAILESTATCSTSVLNPDCWLDLCWGMTSLVQYHTLTMMYHKSACQTQLSTSLLAAGCWQQQHKGLGISWQPQVFDCRRHAGRRIFQEALAAGTMEGFFQLVEQFRCGPAFLGA